MKLIALLLLVIASLTAGATTAKASDYCYTGRSYCAPTYVCTRVICRNTECRYGYDHCGRRVSYYVTVVTYADYYSDGSSRTYTRTV